MSERPPATSITEVVELYERWGHDRYDEEVTQLQHALQTATLASEQGAPGGLVVAALLHDVGHLLELEARVAPEPPGHRSVGDDADLQHEAIGARYLGELFGSVVTAPIALHVRAKRYRCAVDPPYAERLSTGSTTSLRRQGGPLAPAEARAFESNPGFDAAMRLRAWDDDGKVVGAVPVALDSFEPLLHEHRAR